MHTEKNSDIDIDNVYDSFAENGAIDDATYASANRLMSDASDARVRLKDEDRVEREQQLSDFKRDREFIILTLQSALKSRNYEEAQEIVFQYRHAIEMDSDFRRLAEFAKSARQERDDVHKILLILDAVPDDDHVKRRALYAQLLKIDPSEQSYKNAYRLASQALGLDTQANKTPVTKTSPVAIILILVGIIVFVGFFLGFILMSSGASSYPEGAVPGQIIIDATDNVDIKDKMEPTVNRESTDLNVREPDVQKAK